MDEFGIIARPLPSQILYDICPEKQAKSMVAMSLRNFRTGDNVQTFWSGSDQEPWHFP
jgi:hypothetical protein